MAAYKPERGRGHDDSPSRGDRSRKAAYKHPTGRPHGGSVSASRSHARKNSAGTDSPSESLTSKVTDAPSEARICDAESQQLVSGAVSDAEDNESRYQSPSVQKAGRRKRGRPRRARSMGRYPWKSCTIAYLDAVKPYYGERTLKTVERGLKIIGEAFGELHKAGRASTTNPKSMTGKDVEALLDWMKKRKTNRGIGLKGATQSNYIGYLTNLLRWVDNPVTDRMKMAQHVHFPQKVSPEIKVLSEVTARQLVDSLETMPGWEGRLARTMISVYLSSGLRCSELRRARLQDVNTETWQILVVHPKGINRWATESVAPILPPGRQPLLDFLTERRKYLEERGFTECEPLFPFVSVGGKLGYWSEGMWGQVKAKAQKHSGISFNIRQLRATFGQICKDRGASIESVSRALRHRTTKTTELYYTRIRTDHAFRDLENAFSDFDSAKDL